MSMPGWFKLKRRQGGAARRGEQVQREGLIQTLAQAVQQIAILLGNAAKRLFVWRGIGVTRMRGQPDQLQRLHMAEHVPSQRLGLVGRNAQPMDAGVQYHQNFGTLSLGEQRFVQRQGVFRRIHTQNQSPQSGQARQTHEVGASHCRVSQHDRPQAALEQRFGLVGRAAEKAGGSGLPLKPRQSQGFVGFGHGPKRLARLSGQMLNAA